MIPYLTVTHDEREMLGSFEITEYERDARRYRWIRKHGAWETEALLNSLTPDQYDAVLDKRMAEDP